MHCIIIIIRISGSIRDCISLHFCNLASSSWPDGSNQATYIFFCRRAVSSSKYLNTLWNSFDTYYDIFWHFFGTLFWTLFRDTFSVTSLYQYITCYQVPGCTKLYPTVPCCTLGCNDLSCNDFLPFTLTCLVFKVLTKTTSIMYM